MKVFLQKSLAPGIFFIFFTLTWEFLPKYFDIPTYVLPELGDVLRALFDPNATSRYIDHAVHTLSEAGIGLIIGAGSGLLVGLLLAEVAMLYRTFYPYIVAIQSIPKVALAPLFVIWFGFGMASKVVVVVLLTFFPVLVNTINGLKGVDADQLDLFRANGASRAQMRWKLFIPAALPSIFTGLEIAVVMSMLGAIVAEFVGSQKGLGVLILQAQSKMQTEAVFALLMILSLLGICLNLLVRIIRRKVVFWMPGEKD